MIWVHGSKAYLIFWFKVESLSEGRNTTLGNGAGWMSFCAHMARQQRYEKWVPRWHQRLMFHLQKTHGICQSDSKAILPILRLTANKALRVVTKLIYQVMLEKNHPFWTLVYLQ